MINNQSNINDAEKIAKCFSYLQPEELEFLGKKKKQITYLKGETIFKQGAFAPYVLFVIDGLARVYLQTGNNKQINIWLAKQSDYMAFSAVFNETIYPYSAIALKDSIICMIDKEALKQVLMQNPAFGMRITAKNYRNENRYLEIIYNVSEKQMRGKLASTLLYLSSEEFLEENVFQYLTRQEIADFASITTESAIKYIKEFEKEGILTLDGKNIHIENKELLEEISRRG
ncbi:MAG: Crp/Fnr family transcriptional regulator [Bacteroidales bacterium]|nr:Crp/Fnr family transcriptional regulator [Bacteroidales bacterium]